MREIKINYKKPHKVPVRLEYTEDELVINVAVRYHKKMLMPYENKDNLIKAPDILLKQKSDGFTFADAFEEGITNLWGGEYDMSSYGGSDKFKVTVRIQRITDEDYPSNQKSFKVKFSSLTNTSFVISPIWKWFWGYFIGRKECATLNWSRKTPGTINMKKYSRLKSFEHTCAHEFGHVLGLGDAYAAFYRFYYPAPGTITYMMYHNNKVAPEELYMVLKAHATGKMQYFPCKFKFSNIKANLFKK